MCEVYFASTCFFMAFLFKGVRSFESFAPMFLISCSCSDSIRTPAKTIGPRTGPLPASSIPISFVMGVIEKKAL